MNKRLLAIPATIIIIIIILAIALAGNNFFSTNIQNESTPNPTTSTTPTFSQTPSGTTTLPTSPTPAAYALTINYSEIQRDVQTNAIDITIAMTTQNNEESSRNMIYDNFYLTVDGVDIVPIAQTQGNFYVDPNTTHEATIWMRFKEIGTNYKLNYRDNSFNIEWVKVTPAQTPTPPYAVTLQYKETDRRILTSNDVTDPKFVNYTFIKIGITAQSNDGKTHDLTYENFYLTVNGVEITAANQLSGTWAFNNKDESAIWMMFKEIGTNYELNYKGSSFNIDWIKQ